MTKHQGRQASVRGRLDVPAPAQLVVAADGATNAGRRFAFGYIATDSRWGCSAHQYPLDADCPGGNTVAELRAIAYAVKAIGLGRPIRLRTDSRSAIHHLVRWRTGDMALPTGYAAGPRLGGGVLAWLAGRLAADSDSALVVVEEAHAHGPLADRLVRAADSLASAALQLPSWAPKQVLIDRAEMIAGQTLLPTVGNPGAVPSGADR